jgi:hypothetical protein
MPKALRLTLEIKPFPYSARERPGLKKGYRSPDTWRNDPPISGGSPRIGRKLTGWVAAERNCPGRMNRILKTKVRALESLTLGWAHGSFLPPGPAVDVGIP